MNEEKPLEFPSPIQTLHFRCGWLLSLSFLFLHSNHQNANSPYVGFVPNGNRADDLHVTAFGKMRLNRERSGDIKDTF